MLFRLLVLIRVLQSRDPIVGVATMPVALFNNLCWRIVWLYFHRDTSVDEIADLLVVSTRTVRRIIKLYREFDEIEPAHQRYGPLPTLDARGEMVLAQWVLDMPNAYLDELQTALYNSTAIFVSLSTIFCTLKRLGFTRKQLRHVVLRRSEIEQTAFMEEMGYISADMLIWIGESGSDRRN